MMNCKEMSITLLACILISVNGGANEIEKSDTITIHLPREIEIEGAAPTLEQVSIIRGDSKLVSKAEKIPLGKLVVTGQSLTISREVLLGRLASNGIPSSKVKMTGAKEVVIRQHSRAISANDFVELAKAYLAKYPPSQSICESEVSRLPEEMAMTGQPKEVKLVPRLVVSNTPGLAKIEIGVFADGVKVGNRDVTFRLKYSGHKYVALVDITAGTMITADKVKIEKTVSNFPSTNEVINPYGMIAKRNLSANTEIKTNMIGPVEPPVVFKRNQSVVIKIEKFGLTVTAMGKALDDGKVGQYVKVQNIDSGRMIVAKVSSDGTVAPVF